MKIFAAEPIGQKSYLLMDTMVETFVRHGHTFTDDPSECDVCFFDLHTGVSPFCREMMGSIVNRGCPVVVFDQNEYGHAPPGEGWTDWNPLNRPTWFGLGDKSALKEKAQELDWAFWLSEFFVLGQVKLYFMRRMTSLVEFPDYVRPLDLVIYPDHDFQAASFEEFASRPNDICFIGGRFPWRSNVIEGLSACGFKIDFQFINETGRIPHDEWLGRQEEARLYVSGDGPEDSSDRHCQLTTLAVRLKLRSFHRVPNPWTHGVNCIEACDATGRIQDGDCEMIRALLDDPARLYQIYLNGIDHLHAHYTPEARSEYILLEMGKAAL